MGVNIESSARHPSTIGVAVNTGCWAHRRGKIRINAEIEFVPRPGTGGDASRSSGTGLVDDASDAAGSPVPGKPADAKAAKDAGCRFAVSPGYTAEIGAACRELALPLLPGVSTASEVMAANADGLNFLKFFPATAAGGKSLISVAVSSKSYDAVKIVGGSGHRAIVQGGFRHRRRRRRLRGAAKQSQKGQQARDAGDRQASVRHGVSFGKR